MTITIKFVSILCIFKNYFIVSLFLCKNILLIVTLAFIYFCWGENYVGVQGRRKSMYIYIYIILCVCRPTQFIYLYFTDNAIYMRNAIESETEAIWSSCYVSVVTGSRLLGNISNCVPPCEKLSRTVPAITITRRYFLLKH